VGQSRVAAAAALLACACSAPLRVPPLEGAQSALILFETDSGIVAYANGLVDSDAPLSFAPPAGATRLTLFLFRRSLDDLQIPKGAVMGAPEGRPIPAADAIYESLPSFQSWAVTASVSRAVSAFRLPLEAPAACAARGGCYDHQTEDLCVACPTPPQVAPPSFADAPTAPDMLPCPAGWTSGTLLTEGSPQRSFSVCEPYPNGLSNCRSGVWLPGTSTCADVGPACPSGPWPDGLPASRVVYALSGASSGDGSLARPFGTLKEALAVAGPTDTIALSAGLFAESATISSPVTIVGACAQKTQILALTVTTSTARLRALSIVGRVQISGSADLAGIAVVDADPGSIAAIHVVGGALVARGVSIAGSAGGGVWLDAGSADLSELAISRSGTVAILARSGSQLRLSQSVIFEAQAGISLTSGASAQITSSVIARTGGPCFASVGATATISDSVLRTRGDLPSSGMSMSRSAITLDRVWIESANGVGLDTEAATILTGRDLIVDGLDGTPTQEAGFLLGESKVTLERVLITGTGGAMYTGSLFGDTTLRDLTITGIHTGDYQGISHFKGRLEVDRALIEDCDLFALRSSGDDLSLDPSLVISELRIARTGGGIELIGARTATLSRVAISDVRGSAIVLDDELRDTKLYATDLAILRTVPAHCGGQSCAGAGLEDHRGMVQVHRFSIADSKTPALVVEPMGQVDLSDGAVSGNAIAVEAVLNYDLRRLMRRVVFTDNALFFQALQ
jgi:hypothetical protein